MNHFLSIESLRADELVNLVDHSLELKKNRRNSTFTPLAGQHWAMIFEKSSTRTRVSFEVGISELGGNAMFFSGRDLQLSRGEAIEDTARVLGRLVDGVIIRTFAQSDVEGVAQHSGIPTINALTDDEHPCQIISDLLTIHERIPNWRKARVCFIGDGDCNMARSWIWAAAYLEMELVICAPAPFQPPAEFLEKVGSPSVEVIADPHVAVEGCDVIYTDVWVSMGKEEESQERLEILRPYQINDKLMSKTGKDTIVMHCLPAYREKEITSEVFEAHADVIFDQAENRLHAHKAILCRSVAEER